MLRNVVMTHKEVRDDLAPATYSTSSRGHFRRC
jgi:hypothetical protein